LKNKAKSQGNMLEKDFNQFIRDQFEDHSSPVPADMWRRIKGKDDKDRKALLFWKWYFLGPAFLALSLVGGLLFFHHAIPIHPAAPAAPLTASATPAAPLTSSPTPATAAPGGSPASAAPATIAGSVTPTPNSPAAPPNAAPTPAASPAFSASAASPTPAAPLTASAATTPSTPPLASNESVPHQHSDRPSPPPMPPATAGTHRPQSLSCPDPSKKFTSSKGWYLEALGSPDYPFPRGSIPQLPRLSYTAGIRLTKIFESGFLMTAGLQYSWINLRNKYDSLPLPDHFRNLDLPLLIGYEKGNDRFKIGIRGGMIFNIHSSAAGDPYFSNYLKSNTGLSSYIGLELIRQINDRISIFTEPYYKHQFSDMFKNPFVEKIDVGGIFLGVRITLKSSNQ
jgi:hypothetical protein